MPRTDLLQGRAKDLGVALGDDACAAVLDYLDAMLEKNRHLNLTAIREPGQAEVLHALDSLAVALTGITAERALDLGSGNGFPGVALAALCPQAEVTLMERTAKKARALEELVADSALSRVRVLHLDADQAPGLKSHLLAHFDLVVARALAAPREVARMAAPLTAPDGHLVLWLEHQTEVEMEPSLGFEVLRQIDYELPEPAARTRKLALCRRIASAPGSRP